MAPDTRRRPEIMGDIILFWNPNRALKGKGLEMVIKRAANGDHGARPEGQDV